MKRLLKQCWMGFGQLGKIAHNDAPPGSPRAVTLMVLVLTFWVPCPKKLADSRFSSSAVVFRMNSPGAGSSRNLSPPVTSSRLLDVTRADFSRFRIEETNQEMGMEELAEKERRMETRSRFNNQLFERGQGLVASGSQQRHARADSIKSYRCAPLV